MKKFNDFLEEKKVEEEATTTAAVAGAGDDSSTVVVKKKDKKKYEPMKRTPELEEAKGKLVKNMRVKHIHSGNKGTVIKGGDRSGGRVEVEWEDGKTTVAAGKYLEPIKEEAELDEARRMPKEWEAGYSHGVSGSDRDRRASAKYGPNAHHYDAGYAAGRKDKEKQYSPRGKHQPDMFEGKQLDEVSSNLLRRAADRAAKKGEEARQRGMTAAHGLQSTKAHGDEAEKRAKQRGKFSRASTDKMKKELGINEESPLQALKNKAGKIINKKNYEAALGHMKKTGKSAADAARMFKGVDARTLQKHYETQTEGTIMKSPLFESHFNVGDEVVCKASGMEGEVVAVGDESKEDKYYTVKRQDGKMMKYSPEELALQEELDEAKMEPAKADPKAAARRKAIERAMERKKNKDNWYDDEPKSKTRKMGGSYGYGQYDEEVEAEESLEEKMGEYSNWSVKAAGKQKTFRARHAGEALRKATKSGHFGNTSLDANKHVTKESVELEEARILTKTASKEEEKAAQQGYKDGLKRVNRNPYQGTERTLQDAYTTGQMVARSKLKESVELEEATYGFSPVVAKGQKAKDYMAKKAQQRRDMNTKNDPGAAKKHLALSVLDKEKARAKAKKKGANPSEFEYATGAKPNKMTMIQKGLDPKKARSGKRKLPEDVEQMMKAIKEEARKRLEEEKDS